MHGVQNYNKTEGEHIVTEAKVNHNIRFYKMKGFSKIDAKAYVKRDFYVFQ